MRQITALILCLFASTSFAGQGSWPVPGPGVGRIQVPPGTAPIVAWSGYALGSSATTTVTRSVVAGRGLIFLVSRPLTGAFSSITATGASISPVLVAQVSNAGSDTYAGIYYVQSAPSGITSLNLDVAYTGTNSLYVLEVTGLAASPVDVTKTNAQPYDAGTAWTSGASSTLAQANELLVSVATQRYAPGSPSWTGTGGWTIIGTADGNGLGQYITVSSIGPHTASGTLNSTAGSIFSTVLASFKGQ